MSWMFAARLQASQARADDFCRQPVHLRARLVSAGLEAEQSRKVEGSLLGCHNQDMRAEAAGLIAMDPEVLHGQAHIKGTRIGVSAVLEAIAAGMSTQEILEEYPT